MANYTIANGTSAQLVNVNAGGVDVDAFSYKDGVTLTGTELASLLDGTTFGTGVAVFSDLAANAQAAQRKRAVAIAGLYVSA